MIVNVFGVPLQAAAPALYEIVTIPSPDLTPEVVLLLVTPPRYEEPPPALLPAPPP